MSLHIPVRNRIVVVTGGGSGIGLAYGLLARKKGAKNVILADLRLTAAAQEAVQSDRNLIFQQCDVTKWRDLQEIIDVSLAKLGDVPDIYLASAGVFEPIKLTRLALRALLGREKQGVVVLMSSVSGYIKNYPSPLYVASKHALVGFTRSMGDAEQHQGIKVACICPGNVSTPLWTEGTPGAGARYGLTDKNSLTADTVAETISEVVESPDIPGGAVIEVSLPGTQVLPEWNISPPPAVDDKTDGRRLTELPEIIRNLLSPIVR